MFYKRIFVYNNNNNNIKNKNFKNIKNNLSIY